MPGLHDRHGQPHLPASSTGDVSDPQGGNRKLRRYGKLTRYSDGERLA
jgi:hypothetical protein